MAALFPWLNLHNVSQAWNGSTEMGVDIGMPVGTEITSLTDGKVVGAGYYGGGGVVTVRAKKAVFGKDADVYYQHLDLIASGIKVGVKVQMTTLLGYSGGQLHGGHHPAEQKYSSGPHLEVGVNPPWYGIWGPKPHPGPNENPAPWLATHVVDTGEPAQPAQTVQSQGSSSGNPFNVLSPNDSVTTLLFQMDQAMVIVNPFAVDLTQVQQDGILGVSFTDPVDYAKNVAMNTVADLRGLIIRLILLAIGVLLAYQAFKAIAGDPVGAMQQKTLDVVKTAAELGAFA